MSKKLVNSQHIDEGRRGFITLGTFNPIKKRLQKRFDRMHALLFVDCGIGKTKLFSSETIPLFIPAALPPLFMLYTWKIGKITRRRFMAWSAITAGAVSIAPIMHATAESSSKKQHEIYLKRLKNAAGRSGFDVKRVKENESFLEELAYLSIVQKNREKPLTLVYLKAHGMYSYARNKPTTWVTIRGKDYSAEEIIGRIAEINGKKLVFIDCCYGKGVYEAVEKHPKKREFFLAVSSMENPSDQGKNSMPFLDSILAALNQGGEMSSYFIGKELESNRYPYAPKTIGKFML